MNDAMKFSIAFLDMTMARTVYYDRLMDAAKASAHFTEDDSSADILFPAEDTAMETNWPRYGNRESAFIRGAHDLPKYDAYVQRVALSGRGVCIINMDPSVRLPLYLRNLNNVIVADGCLPVWERVINPRTISMPALPVIIGGAPVTRTVLASFRGVKSHPCRKAIFNLHDGKDFICQPVSQDNHLGLLDATVGKSDMAFADLMATSTFAIVPRGDSLFSYRLLEAMSFGCVPIIVSDGWVLPFDRVVDWQNVALHIPESEIRRIPFILKSLSAERIVALQTAVANTYAAHFATLDAIIATLAAELRQIVKSNP